MFIATHSCPALNRLAHIYVGGLMDVPYDNSISRRAQSYILIVNVGGIPSSDASGFLLEERHRVHDLTL